MPDLQKIYPRGKKILFIGTVPPPLGGVSVHLSRLFDLMQKEKYDVHIFDFSKKYLISFQKYLLLSLLIIHNHFDIIHIHSSHLKLIILIRLLKKIKKFKLYFTDHNLRLFDSNNLIKKRILKNMIRELDYLIIVNPDVLKKYKQKKIVLSKDILIQNAFIPPIINEEKDIMDTYGRKTLKFISSHKPLLIANAYQLAFFQGQDLYGLDMCVELTAKLVSRFPNIGFLFVLANENVNKRYLKKIKKRIYKCKINDNFHFIIGQKQLWPLLKIVDLSVRVTVTDGDAVSIREALYFGCPVIASDISNRPEGTVLFKNRDINDLYQKCFQILAERK